MKELYQRWKKLAEKIGNFQASLIFSILYFAIVTPLGLIVGLFADFLGQRRGPGWNKIKDNPETIKDLRAQ